MEEIIKINDIEYIKREEFDKIRENIKKDLLQESQNIELNQLNWGILDSANVMGIVPFNRKEPLEDTEGDIKIKGMGNYREVKDVEFTKINKSTLKAECFKLMSTKFSTEFLIKSKKIADIMQYTRQSEPTFYLRYDTGFIQDQPCLIRYDNIIFLLAPRIEDG